MHSILSVQFTFLTVFLHNLCPSPLWSTCWSDLTPSTLYSIHFFTQSGQSLYSFCSTCPHQCNLCCCSSVSDFYALHIHVWMFEHGIFQLSYTTTLYEFVISNPIWVWHQLTIALVCKLYLLTYVNYIPEYITCSLPNA